MQRQLFSWKVILLLLCSGILYLPVSAKQSGTRNRSRVAYRNSYQRIGGGAFHTLEIRGGTLWAWGRNQYGQLGIGNTTDQNTPVQVGSATNWLTVSVSNGSHSMGIKADGTLWAWGRNLKGQLGIANNTDQSAPVQVGAATNWVSIATGAEHTIAVKADGTLWAWGGNQYGQLGIGNTTDQNAPVQVGVALNWIAVATGDNFTMAIKADGTLWAWGQNASGQLGIGNTTQQNSPVQVGVDNKWVCISGNADHAHAVKTDGTLWGWGNNANGVIGDGTIINQSSPVQVAGAAWVSVSDGNTHALATKADGTLWTWGDNTYGQLGLGNNTNQTSPAQVGANKIWMNVVANNGSSMALKADGTLWAFGYNAYGNLGTGNNTDQNSPVQTSVTLNELLSMGCSFHTIICKTNGSLLGWGYNNTGGLGIGNNTSVNVPVAAGGVGTYIAVSTGHEHTLAIKADGTLWACGTNTYGQLGIGNTVNQNTPVQVGTSTWVNISAGLNHSLGIKSDGTLWAWGGNFWGNLGTGNTTQQTAPVQIGVANNWIAVGASEQFSVALKSDGTVWSWGDNVYSELGIGPSPTQQNTPAQVSISDVADVQVGTYFALCLKANGTISDWGLNSHGELGLGNTTQHSAPVSLTGFSNCTVVVTGDSHSMGIQSNGTLWSWGRNSFGALGLGDYASHYSPVQVSGQADVIQGGYTEFAYDAGIFKAQRDVVCLTGDNQYGQLGNGNNTGSNVFSCINACLPVTPTVSITASPGNTICSGTSVTFTATITNGGPAPVYVWKKNNVVVGTNSSTYTDNGLANGNTITCTLTSNAGCASPATLTSNTITMTVTPTVTPTVSIVANPGSTICAGTPVTFTATITNGGPNPTYVWKKDNVVVGTNSNTYTDNGLTNGNVITCTLTSNATCANPATVTSTAITMTVNPVLVPTISITANPAGPICAGTPVTFTATITNGGPSPTYTWKKDNIVVGTNSTTYTDNGLANGNVITCTLTSNATCANPTTLTSNSITITVSPVLVPTVTITANPAGPICAGTPVAFTATITNGGPSPTYTWKKDNVTVGGNSNTYTDNGLTNGNVITCTLTSNATCAAPAAVTSTGITMTVNPVLVPSVTIAANPNGPVCPGTPVTFTATVTNGGPNPTYVWKKDNIVVGSNQSTYSDNTLINGNVITCELTSNATCANPTTVTSNSITMTVNAVLVPTISIAANPNGPVCAGTPVTFTATITNGGPSPTYQWYNGATPVGINQDTYTDNGLNNGDVITCVLTSNATCANPQTITSNAYTMTVNPVLVPSVSIAGSPGLNICTGQLVTFTATPANGGPAPIYQWKKNGNPVGNNSATYSDNLLNDADVVTCELTSNATCANPTTATSNNATISWNAANNVLAGTTGNTETNAVLLTAPVSVRYTDCDLMATITPNGASPVSGNTTLKVTIDNAVNTFNAQPYLQRHFDIEPATSPATSTATITLYAYQSEFDAYNTVAVPLGYPALPTGATDNGNVRITQFHGTGTAPGNYSGTEELIVPTVSWDATNSWWVMNFPITGFSGFYIHTNLLSAPLAVNEPTDISAINVGAKNKVEWFTQHENAGDVFTLERSATGGNFTAITELQGKGAASVYTYWDEQPVQGINYYRVKLTNAAGQSRYTKVVSATVQQAGFVLEAYPNPVLNNVTITARGTQVANGYVTLMDVAGKTILKVQMKDNTAHIDMSSLAQGMYMLRYNDGTRTGTIRIGK